MILTISATAQRGLRAGYVPGPVDAHERDAAGATCRGKVEAAVKRPVQKAIGEAEGSHVQAFNGAPADAQQKMAAQAA